MSLAEKNLEKEQFNIRSVLLYLENGRFNDVPVPFFVDYIECG